VQDLLRVQGSIEHGAAPGEVFLYGTGVVAAGFGGWEAGTYLNYVTECDGL
jgi:hypothetical protein